MGDATDIFRLFISVQPHDVASRSKGGESLLDISGNYLSEKTVKRVQGGLGFHAK
jgi:hypothetical protein